MTTTKKKAGRKPKNYRTADNRTIDGLVRQPDGRLKIIATGQRFTEPDERLAVAHFDRLTGQGTPASRGELTLHAGREEWPEYDAQTSARVTVLDTANELAEVTVPPAVLWAYLRQEGKCSERSAPVSVVTSACLAALASVSMILTACTVAS